MSPNNIFHGYKTLLEALEAADTSSSHAKKYLDDKRLTKLEKSFVEYIIKMRVNDFSFVDELSQNKSFESVPFLNSLRHLILGAVHIYRCDSVLGEYHLNLALPYLKESQNITFINRMVFRVEANLFYNYVNQKRLTEMKKVFKTISLLQKNEVDERSFLIMQACFYSMTEEYEKAEMILKEIETIQDQLNDIQAISYKIEELDFFVKLELFNKAEKVLVEMKKLRTFRLSATFKYSQKLLSYLSKDERLYVYEKDFTDGKDLFAMIKVISSLDEGNESEAHFYWCKLAELSPETYRPEYNYVGDKCLFSLALKKCLAKAEPLSIKLEAHYTAKEKSFIECFLKASSNILTKEELFFTLYQRELETKEELAAISMLASRINKKGEVQIKSKKGSYYLSTLIDSKAKSA